MILSVRGLLREFMPPVFVRAVTRVFGRETVFVGPYSDWAAARQRSGGYEDAAILARVEAAMREVKEGRAAAERDSVILDRVDYAPAVLAGFLAAASDRRDGSLAVLDFGGSLGSSYYRYRGLLTGIGALRWRIVEQPNFVACGNKLFMSGELSFHADIGDAVGTAGADVALFSSSLQYTEKPYEVLRVFMDRAVPYLIFDRMFFTDRPDDIVMVQRVPRTIYDASYPVWFFSREKFFAFLGERYAVVMECDSSVERPLMLRCGLRALPRGVVLKLKKGRAPHG